MNINKILKNNSGEDLLYYKKAATDWNEALPVGNGRFGGMVFGGAFNELIQLNEDSIWSGDFRKRDNPNAYPDLEKVRELIAEGKVTAAEKLIEHSFYGRGEQMRHYMPLGDLHIELDAAGECENYVRGLSLDNGVCFTSFKANGASYSREIFVSYPDSAAVIKYTADKKGAVSLKAYLDGRDDYYDLNDSCDENTVLFTSSFGVKFACAARIISEGGKCFADKNILAADWCDTVYIILSCETEYRGSDYIDRVLNTVEKAAGKGYDELYSRHRADYQRFYKKCVFTLDCGENYTEPTDIRLENEKNGKTDVKLAALYFNFSKYLMIAGSREGSLPLNLQGIWNKDMWPAWGGKYTVNINTEMNYWAAEAQDLGECCTPLFDHIERMRHHGRVTAREMYNCKGAVCHHNTDIWGDCAPQDKWMPATIWPMGLAWLCLHIYEHYRYTCDMSFLARKYGTMCEAAEFFLDYLIEDDKGRLVTSPSVSPENTYITRSGEKGSICMGPSMDSQILYTLFTDIIEAADIIEADNKDFVEKIKSARSRIPLPQIGKYGQIMEWSEDYDEVEPGHRHISQLFALYPGEMITPEKTPELAAAAQATIERRLSHGGGHTGWSRAWIINMWARLHNGEKVGENIHMLLAHSTAISMLDMHPPFQIDGNFGGGAGIAEALMQSHSGYIQLAPAVPEEWKNFTISGMRARGGFSVSYKRRNGAFDRITVMGNNGSICRVCGKYYVSCRDLPVDVTFENGCTVFETKAGEEYEMGELK